MNPTQQMDTTKESTVNSTNLVQGSNKGMFIAIAVFIIGLAMVVMAALIIISGMSNQNKSQYENNTQQTQEDTKSGSTDKSTIEQSDTGTTTKNKLLVDVTKPWFRNTQYPEEILSLSDDKLKELNCTEKYFYAADGKFEPNSNRETKVTLDSGFADAAKSIAIYSVPTGFDIYRCNISTEEFPKEVYIYSYCKTNCGGAIGKVFGMFWWYAGSKQVEFPNETGAYAQCDSPIALTSDNKFYFGCEAGDGLYSAASIYKFDFNEIKRIAFEDRVDEVSSYMSIY